MLCDKELLEIRRRREEELQEYQQLCSKIGSGIPADQCASVNEQQVRSINPLSATPEKLVAKRRSILILEFPFQTDAVSVNEARVRGMKFADKVILEEKTVERWARQYFQGKDKQNIYKQNQSVRFIKNNWPKFVTISYNSTGEEKLSELQEVPFLDIGRASPEEALFRAIDGSRLKSGSKKVLRSIIARMISYTRTPKMQCMPEAIVRKGCSCEDLAQWYEYLERRCLNAFSIKPYRDLIESRLLFYVPLSISELRKVSLNHIQSRKTDIGMEFFIRLEDRTTYRIPRSFVDLAKSLDLKNEPLLRRNGKELCDFVKKSTKAAQIGENITPNLVQRSSDSICRAEGYVDKNLPSR